MFISSDINALMQAEDRKVRVRCTFERQKYEEGESFSPYSVRPILFHGMTLPGMLISSLYTNFIYSNFNLVILCIISVFSKSKCKELL